MIENCFIEFLIIKSIKEDKLLESFNFCEYEFYLDDLKKKNSSISKLIKEIGVNGLEMFVYDKVENIEEFKDFTIGAHLKYWPHWLAFWKDDKIRLAEEFEDFNMQIKYYNAKNKEEWLNNIRLNILEALKLNPKYLVWHVSECNEKEIYTFKFKYSDAEVIKSTIDLINEVSDVIPEDVCILFENLWWPGLRMNDVEQVKLMFGSNSKLKHKNVGVMFDLGHFANTNMNLKNEEEIVRYFEKTYKSFGKYGEVIRGFHLSKSLSGEYLKNFKKVQPQKLDMKKVFSHISKIDQHRPFTNNLLKCVIDLVKPEYVVHELFYNDIDDLKKKVLLQRNALK